ncbi:DUF547 domain-containing protein [Zooshikella harenae]|uniref:DUF547 domain-containing protein n=1 Tax=Zooshikella harenae TaxID=2827238 RepID=A0ABS5Z6Y1_9GAMM|nr:DUF547 domain-containing protein [Zooshikella harenae]MBU2709808.1 DUF547 domain-containing protein [Zooshikella harenae]
MAVIRFLITLLSFWVIPTVYAAPKATYWAFWDKATQSSHQIDHQLWQSFLDQYLVLDKQKNIYLVNYQAASKKGSLLLSDYIKQLTVIDPRQYNLKEQFAYWVNLYNALTVQLVLKHYPVSSITKLGEGLFSFGPWEDPIVSIVNQSLTLNDIEHRILRPIWQDPRIHYVVNCASIGCPDLQPKALTAQLAEQQLDVAAKRFVNQRKGVSWQEGELLLSKIYDWYSDDFGESEGRVIAHLLRYAEKNLADKLRQYQGDINYQYDWQLNAIH